MGDEKDVQPDYEQRLEQLAEEGPLHVPDIEAGVVDKTDETQEEPEEPHFETTITIDGRG